MCVYFIVQAWEHFKNTTDSLVILPDDPGHVILLSHIPLSRAETAECGPLREKGTIGRGAGSGYQSMLGKQTTNFLLKRLQPLIVFRCGGF